MHTDLLTFNEQTLLIVVLSHICLSLAIKKIHKFTRLNDNCRGRDSTICYLNNHLDSGQSGGQVLGMGGPDSNRHTASVQAAIESGNQVDSCARTFNIITVTY